MGILSVVNRNLVSNSKSRLKYLSSYSSSSNLWLSRRAHSQSPSKKKPMFVIEHHYDSVNRNIRFPSYNYSLISAENSWKDYHNLCNRFSAIGHDSKFYYLAGSCNELMLVFFEMNLSDREALWNPTTNEVKILPESDVQLPPHSGPAITNILAHGFGFDPKSADYKLIRFAHISDEDNYYTTYFGHTHVDLYSLKTNSWKKITSYPFSYEPQQHHSVHINGVYYWKKGIDSESPANSIISFDIANEKFSCSPHIPRPPKFDERQSSPVDDFVLVEFDGSLAALVHSEFQSISWHENIEKPFTFEVWGWNGESWLEKMPRITIHVTSGVLDVLGLFQDDKLFLHGFNKRGELLLFDCATSKLENLGIRAYRGFLNIFPYAESSVPFTFTGN